VKPALDMVAHGLLTPYHIRRKRQMVSGHPVPRDSHGGDQLDDPL
jgi:hypothetical protein